MTRTIAIVSSKGYHTLEHNVKHVNLDFCEGDTLIIIEHEDSSLKTMRFKSENEEFRQFDLYSLSTINFTNFRETWHYSQERVKNREEDVKIIQLFMQHKLTAQMLVDCNIELQHIKRAVNGHISGVDVIPTWVYEPKLAYIEKGLKEAYDAVETYGLLNPNRCLDRLKQEQNTARVYEYIIEHRLEIMEQLLKTTTT